jgi:hypothetical protein
MILAGLWLLVSFFFAQLDITVELSGLRQLACLFAFRHAFAKSMTASKSATVIC